MEKVEVEEEEEEDKVIARIEVCVGEQESERELIASLP